MDTLLKLLDGPFGGHAFKVRDFASDLTTCVYCYGTVSEWELEEGLWPARLGLDCPALVFRLDRITQ